MTRISLCAAALLLAGCSAIQDPPVPPAPMGTFRALAWDTMQDDVLLTTAACTAIIQIDALPPGEFYRGHLTFLGRDPEDAREPRCHDPGPYPYFHAYERDLRVPRRCGDGDIPSLGGCRQVSVPVPGGVQVQSLFLYLASNEPIDPYRTAWELESALVRHPDLGEALWRREVGAAAALLEGAMEDVPGSSTWAGLLLVPRLDIRRGWRRGWR